jgi:hypothetical protein
MRAEVVVFAVCVAACLVAHVAIVRSVLRARGVASDPGVPRPRLVVEIAWALVPALALALVLTATWSKVQDHAGAPTPSLLMRVAR